MRIENLNDSAVPKRACRPGFTLMELLIVIAILAVLALLIFGLTTKMMQKAKRTSAISAMRQVTSANIAYSAENFGNINTIRFSSPFKDPVEGDIPGVAGDGYVSNSFWGRCSPYLFPGLTGIPGTGAGENKLNEEIISGLNLLFGTPNCNTMSKTIMSGTPIISDGSGRRVPFAFNSKMTTWGKFAKTSTFDDPSRILWAVYGYSTFNNTHGQAYSPLPKSGTKPTDNIYYFDHKKAIGAFLDGHIEELSPPLSEGRFE
jgi:prepilin-type N-terminal cleavage/methylation domain-containing protein